MFGGFSMAIPTPEFSVPGISVFGEKSDCEKISNLQVLHGSVRDHDSQQSFIPPQTYSVLL